MTQDPTSQGSTSEGLTVQGAPPVEATLVDPKLLELLVCPLTKGTLEYDVARQELISRSAKLAYPIRDGIPIMLPEEARPLTD
ncbi:Trm112 family protein [uncultured Methylobacterium sp.]|uniref:Trm112 family protein n=1 Tax=uncultured Methylobacterium sp. TaxID=157278 RepID=UPI0035CBB1CC